ncbi:MAG: AEC family transporter [Anaerolineae bacterium]
MSEIAGLFVDNLLPILAIAGIGYVLAATITPDPRTLSLVVFHVFSPALIFALITDSQLSGGDMAHMAAFAAGTLLLVGAIAALVGRAMRLPRHTRAALVLTAMLPNAGNYGLSLNMFAFGNDALAHAAVFFATSAALTYTVGVFVASLGRADTRTALHGLLRTPTVYAVLMALVVVAMGWQLPVPVERTVDTLAQGAIPAFLIVLGMQLHRAGPLRPTALQGMAVALRLAVSPAVAVGLVAVMGLTGPARTAGVVEAAMPTAVVTTVLAEVFDVEPSFVTAVVFASTILSPITLTPLLAWLTP